MQRETTKDMFPLDAASIYTADLKKNHKQNLHMSPHLCPLTEHSRDKAQKDDVIRKVSLLFYFRIFERF